MSQQEGGWPLGLQPLNMRVGLVRSRELSGSISFSTLLSDSPSSSSVTSSDLDTQSTGSFFPDKSTTLGNLIGISSILELSGRRPENSEVKKTCRVRTWFSLCTKACGNGCNSPNHPQSLGHFLEVERKAAGVYRRRNRNLTRYRRSEFHEFRSVYESNSQFVGPLIASSDESL
ncbi:uncharacterized protein At3g17950-like [Magnolia sinica]|uniref:uncharacterized protein At3g17950-like n=1 Tax=Magnolia sinica TaxID=86752 RepID=UPI00265A4F09|nr:uncharacterized protein At3g17950-like [Magnolia sinica]